MSDPNGAFRRRLLAIFADEARVHLAAIEASLVSLEQQPTDRAAALAAALKALHTLKGAARSVDLDQLERLCHALESLCSALGQGDAAPAASDLDLMHRAVALARELAGAPSGRILNRAAALCGELERSAQARAAVAPEATAAAAPMQAGEPAPLPAPRQEPEREPEPEPEPDQSPAPAALPELLRVDASRLDAIRTEAEALLAAELSLQHHIGELQALAATLAQEGHDGGKGERRLAQAEQECARLARSLGAACTGLSGTRKRLLDAVLETALVPFSEALEELPGLVRKLARGRAREVALGIEGAAVRVDRRVLAVVREALVHLVTNAVDHGIEPAQDRLAAGKSPVGAVRIAVSQPDARHILVRVSDDGAGFDVAALGVAAGLDPDALARLDEPARLALALRAGVSTRVEITPVSGRGVGLAIVADKVAAAGGTLGVDSKPGAGSSFDLLLPVSLASMRALVVASGGQRYAVPLAALEEARLLAPGAVGVVEDRETVVAHGRVLPLVRLARLFGGAGEVDTDGKVALLAGGARPFALLVDSILSEQEVLPRGLGPLLRRVRFFSGATQLGDGALVPVLALDDIADHMLTAAAAAAPQAAPGPAPAHRTRVLVAEDSPTSRLLLKHLLEGAGCEVDTAADGLAALSLLRQGRFDAVVSDIEMPRLDGLELTARIRAEPRTADLPVILVTSLQTPAQRERGLRAGADAYLTKGAFDQDALLAALRRLT